MQVEDFEHSPVGRLVPISGHDAFLNRDYKHFAFVPVALPASIELSMGAHKLADQASMSVGRLDFAVKRLPEPGLLVRPALRREAQSTSAIEGTHATLEEVLEADYVEEANRRAEVREVLNYVHAAELALQLIETKPICLNVIAQLQATLVDGTRGDGWDKGRLRESNVYIGERSRGIEASRFVPPPHGDLLVEGVSDWEKWIHAEDDYPLLIKIAMAHYQFETLHPFSDGNGRLGRLIVTLQLVTEGALTYPLLNLSSWLEDRKDEYKDLLLDVSKSGDFDSWVRFFCEAVHHQAEDGVARIEELLEFQSDLRQKLIDAKARGIVNAVVNSLLGYPIITIPRVAALHNVTYPPAKKAIQTLVELGVLREMRGTFAYGAKVFICDPVMRVLNRA
ncbi:Fic family protein [[Mycobacterium] crassicus]|uniref:Fic/DOC family N-terminal domain-containing protein n=1 Tax=[Mycobacterium] crassicus TaxID=2872309 RepID=A0ABU5XIE9_9MYCO|nr:Fic/DOC family N-terminal domain-containing protein [Mycolicibacter sp. MYC098]MEB3022060.1 Fic/DOC family N-terminal domain-containing protein [Mycolicibacter sp. MYC098]